MKVNNKDYRISNKAKYLLKELNELLEETEVELHSKERSAFQTRAKRERLVESLCKIRDEIFDELERQHDETVIQTAEKSIAIEKYDEMYNKYQEHQGDERATEKKRGRPRKYPKRLEREIIRESQRGKTAQEISKLYDIDRRQVYRMLERQNL